MKTSLRYAATLALGVAAIGLAPAWAQTAKPAATAAKGSAAHIKAVTTRVNTGFIRANARTTVDWPSYGLDHAETRFSRLTQRPDQAVAQ